jgi:hypothetical protein
VGVLSGKRHHLFRLPGSVARWYDFKTKMPVWENYKCLAMKDDGKFYGHFVYFTVI